MWHLLVDLCQFYSYDAPWDQNWPHPGGHNFETKEKDVEFICGENDSGERSRAIMALLFSSPEHNILRVSYCDRSMSVCKQLLKRFSDETDQQISMKLHRNDPWVMHFQNTSKI